jgi:hypothetical protein
MDKHWSNADWLFSIANVGGVIVSTAERLAEIVAASCERF